MGGLRLRQYQAAVEFPFWRHNHLRLDVGGLDDALPFPQFVIDELCKLGGRAAERVHASTPASIMVGTSGAIDARLGCVTASALSLPL